MPLAYVSNFSDGTVSVIDTDPNPPIVVETYQIGGNPFGVALTPDKQRLLVTLYDTGGVFLLEAGLGGGAQLGGALLQNSARGVAVTPDGNRAYVAAYMNELDPLLGTQGYLGMIDISTVPPGGSQNTVGIYGLANPYGVAIYSGTLGTRVYVADLGVIFGQGAVVVFDNNSPTTGPQPLLGYNYENNPFAGPADVAVFPDGLVFATQYSFFDRPTFPEGFVTAVKGFREGLAVPAPFTVDTPGQPAGLAVAANAGVLYVADYYGGIVTAIDVARRQVIASSDAILKGPIGVAVTPNGEWLYVANSASNTVTLMDIESLGKIVHYSIAVGNAPYYIAM